MSSTLEFAIGDHERAIEVATIGILKLGAQKDLIESDVYFLSEFYQDRASAYASLGKNDIALEEYTRAAKYNPASFSAFNNRSKLYFSLGQFELAEADIDKAIENDPESATGYVNLSKILSKQAEAEIAEGSVLKDVEDKLFKAIEAGEKGFDISSDDDDKGEAAYSVALAYASLEERASALEWLNIAYKYSPEFEVKVRREEQDDDYAALRVITQEQPND